MSPLPSSHTGQTRGAALSKKRRKWLRVLSTNPKGCLAPPILSMLSDAGKWRVDNLSRRTVHGQRPHYVTEGLARDDLKVVATRIPELVAKVGDVRLQQ